MTKNKLFVSQEQENLYLELPKMSQGNKLNNKQDFLRKKKKRNNTLEASMLDYSATQLEADVNSSLESLLHWSQVLSIHVQLFSLPT